MQPPLSIDAYRMLRIDAVPKVETMIVPSGDFWGGVGEAAGAAAAQPLCNAIFAATGKRIRSLPLISHCLCWQSDTHRISHHLI
jgi:isoquinoline 1-oxidoreductase beta subunit